MYENSTDPTRSAHILVPYPGLQARPTSKRLHAQPPGEVGQLTYIPREGRPPNFDDRRARL